MPTQTDTAIQLLVGGRVHDRWDSAEVDSDLLTPADAWSVTLGIGAGQALPADVMAGAASELRIDGEQVMSGRIDQIDHDVGKGIHELALSGRDGAAVLLDCAAPIFTARQVSLDDVIAKIVRPLGVSRIRIDADATRTREKINVEPGDTAWAALAAAAEANGLWPWFDPDGTLVVGGPDYSAPTVADLVLRYDGRDNNVVRLTERHSVATRYSQMTVLGQTHGTETATGKHNYRFTATDSGMSWYRPQVVVDYEADSVAVCEDRARKLLADSRLGGYTLTAVVKGPRIYAPGQASHGVLWKPGQRVHVLSEPHGIDAPMFVMGRHLSVSRAGGVVTTLTLKEDGVWTLDAHPHHRKHRRGKNSLPGKIIDLTGAAQ